MSEESRRYAQSMTDLDVVLRNEQGQLVDERAQARDVSRAGFRVETKAKLDEGQRLTFTMDLGEGELVRGAARIVWARVDEWGAYAAGAKIVKISWKDARKLGGQVAGPRPGYDFSGLAKRAFFAFYWLVIVVGARNIIFDQPDVSVALVRSLPALAAALVIGFALMMLFG